MATTRESARAHKPERLAAGSKSAWLRRTEHTLTCPSGQAVTIKIPNLGELLKGDAVPRQLLNVALRALVEEDPLEALKTSGGDGAPGTVDLELVKEFVDFSRWLVLEMLIEPRLSEEELARVPQEDIDFLIAVGQRQVNYDARGVRIGVESVSRYELWRREHGCSEECAACASVAAAFSTQAD